ncbi:MAG TPA: YifB family Mg chelatase-like AAA ATPase [Castellaniella sp.]|uniref:YifB family Mg chelatase-like AAA ATPase n=1 Tax=Castellaniella sp. TaxID=1955812 RepID=UPI002F0FFF74
MSLAVLSSRALLGLRACAVQVEVHVGSGLPSFTLTGLPGAGVRESRDRVRSAILSSGFEFPNGRITANLAPADLPKDSGRFDLPIALAVLMASGQVVDINGVAPEVRHVVLAGELSLTGAIVPTGSALAIALAVAQDDPQAILIMGAQSAAVAALVPGLKVLSATSLSAVVAHFRAGQPLPVAEPVAWASKPAGEALCLSDVRGQVMARQALVLAAAGGHSLLFCGPPGVGKSMLAQRLPGLLPPLSRRDALEVAAVQGLVRSLDALPLSAPFRAPHHGASTSALVGGGAHPRPGEISLAHRGVLFLDELPEFDRRALEALREPLETGHITIARAAGSCCFPASFQLVAAMNPCPCGYLGHPRDTCRCTPERIAQYCNRVSGPLLDRIDLHVTLTLERRLLDLPAGESSAEIQGRVQKAQVLQHGRQGCLNARLDVASLERYAALDAKGQASLMSAIGRWTLSARAVHRIMRVARTLADLEESEGVQDEHVRTAVGFRPVAVGA